MKNAARLICLSLAAVITVSVLCACGSKLSGTYVAEVGLGVATSYTFSGDGVIISVAGIETRGTYKVSGDTLTVTVGSLKSEHSFEKSGDSIFIDYIQFFKQ